MPSTFNFSTLDEKLQKKRVQNKINLFIFYAECIQLLDFRRKVTKNECRTKKIMWNYKLLFKKFTF